MNERNVMKIAMPLALLFADFANADVYKTYDGTWAAKYATKNYEQSYSPKGNPFQNFEKRDSAGKLIPNGGNCTNFVSQALIAGFIQSDSMKTAFDNRYEFDTDYFGINYSLAWYFRSDSQRGPAWSGAQKLYEYAKSNKATYRGVHFSDITKDTKTSFMDYNKVRVGDIIFADWEGDGSIDHSMIVTSYDYWTQRGYDKIQVTYQSENRQRRLGEINVMYKYKALFYVYRPTDYRPDGW